MDNRAYYQWRKSESGKRVARLHATEESEAGGGGKLSEDYTTTYTCGALPSGTTLEEGTTIEEVIKLMTTKVVAPSVTLKAKANFGTSYGTEIRYNRLLETLSTVGFTIVASKRDGGADLTSLEIHAGTAGGTDIWYQEDPVSGTTYTVEQQSTLSNAFVGVVRDSASPNPQIATSIVNVYPCYPRYYGLVSSDAETITTVSGLTMPSLTTSRGMSFSNIDTGGMLKKVVFFYHSSLGNATIKDGQNEDNTDGYTKKTIYFDGTNVSQTAESGYEAYYLYILNVPMQCASSDKTSLTLS